MLENSFKKFCVFYANKLHSPVDLVQLVCEEASQCRGQSDVWKSCSVGCGIHSSKAATFKAA